MKKTFVLIIILLIIGGGYLGYKFWSKKDSTVGSDGTLEQPVSEEIGPAPFRPGDVSDHPEGTGLVVSNELIVEFKEGVDFDRIKEIAQENNALVAGKFSIPPHIFWQFRYSNIRSPNDLRSKKEALSQYSEISTVGYNPIRTLH